MRGRRLSCRGCGRRLGRGLRWGRGSGLARGPGSSIGSIVITSGRRGVGKRIGRSIGIGPIIRRSGVVEANHDVSVRLGGGEAVDVVKLIAAHALGCRANEAVERWCGPRLGQATHQLQVRRRARIRPCRACIRPIVAPAIDQLMAVAAEALSELNCVVAQRASFRTCIGGRLPIALGPVVHLILTPAAHVLRARAVVATLDRNTRAPDRSFARVPPDARAWRGPEPDLAPVGTVLLLRARLLVVNTANAHHLNPCVGGKAVLVEVRKSILPRRHGVSVQVARLLAPDEEARKVVGQHRPAGRREASRAARKVSEALQSASQADTHFVVVGVLDLLPEAHLLRFLLHLAGALQRHVIALVVTALRAFALVDHLLRDKSWRVLDVVQTRVQLVLPHVAEDGATARRPRRLEILTLGDRVVHEAELCGAQLLRPLDIRAIDFADVAVHAIILRRGVLEPVQPGILRGGVVCPLALPGVVAVRSHLTPPRSLRRPCGPVAELAVLGVLRLVVKRPAGHLWRHTQFGDAGLSVSCGILLCIQRRRRWLDGHGDGRGKQSEDCAPSHRALLRPLLPDLGIVASAEALRCTNLESEGSAPIAMQMYNRGLGSRSYFFSQSRTLD